MAECNDLAALRAPVRPPTDGNTRAVVDRLRKEGARAMVLIRAAKYDEAAKLLGPALVTARAIGYRPVEAELLGQLGFTQSKRGSYVAAEATLFDAVVAARAGRHAIAEVNALTQLVRVAALQGHYDEAQRRGRYGLAAFAAIGGTDQRPLARLVLAIGGAAADQGRYDDALSFVRRALAIRQGPHGGDSLDLANAHEAVARVLGDLGRFDESQQQIRQALAIYERDAPDGPSHASSLFNLGFALNGQGRYEEALQAYRRSAAIWERTLGPEHPRMAMLLANIGDILCSLGRYDEALDYD